eukprot:TRINITY_DN577_c0_g1_i5.p1 TRINITY_DN577_c0_g1~~TRINITY_DN577_c0_g1_i5.p1  ORF type:complete len:146 (-),score=37.74 TRINITY_DN577_c0_g1_i5:295-699(-)
MAGRWPELDEALPRLRANDPTLTQGLNLSGKYIGDEDAGLLADALRGNTALKRLYLWKCNITDKGAGLLADALRGNSVLKGLFLERGNNISNARIQELKDVLSLNWQLREAREQRAAAAAAGAEEEAAPSTAAP